MHHLLVSTSVNPTTVAAVLDLAYLLLLVESVVFHVIKLS